MTGRPLLRIMAEINLAYQSTNILVWMLFIVFGYATANITSCSAILSLDIVLALAIEIWFWNASSLRAGQPSLITFLALVTEFWDMW